MLRVEFDGQLHEWFDPADLGALARSPELAGLLRENVARYFGVPALRQAIYDEDGLLTTSADFSRALQRVSPKLYVYDVQKIPPEMRNRTVEALEQLGAEVEQSFECFGAQSARGVARASTASAIAAAAASASAVGTFGGGGCGGEDATLLIPATIAPADRHHRLSDGAQVGALATGAAGSGSLCVEGGSGGTPAGEVVVPRVVAGLDARTATDVDSTRREYEGLQPQQAQHTHHPQMARSATVALPLQEICRSSESPGRRRYTQTPCIPLTAACGGVASPAGSPAARAHHDSAACFLSGVALQAPACNGGVVRASSVGLVRRASPSRPALRTPRSTSVGGHRAQARSPASSATSPLPPPPRQRQLLLRQPPLLPPAQSRGPTGRRACGSWRRRPSRTDSLSA